MRFILFITISTIFFSCEYNPVEEVPAQLKINLIDIASSDQTYNSNTTNITDAWIYVNDNFIGVYPLPTQLPILEKGNATIRIGAGIKKNGISASRALYPFYSLHSEEVILQPNNTIEINPEMEHKIESYPWYEDFESGGTNLSINTDSVGQQIEYISSNEENYFLGQRYGLLKISGEEGELIECVSENLSLPKDKQVYLEIDYKSNTQFVIGLYANSSSQVNKTSIIFLSPNENWNKTYISLSETISNYSSANSYKIFIGMLRDVSIDKNELRVDNIRLVHE